MYEHIARKLATGGIIIIDAGTGTDIHGARVMGRSGAAWSSSRD
jgi:hypothetical protein